MASIKCGHCSGTHNSVQAVRACASGASAETVYSQEGYGDLLPCEAKAIATGKVGAHVERLATEKQYNYVMALVGQKGQHDIGRNVQACWEDGTLTMDTASKLITELKALPTVAKADNGLVTVELEDGMYRNGNQIVKVYHTVHGANQQATQYLMVTKVSAEGDPDKFEGEWDYRGKKGLAGLTPAMLMTEEEAKAFGILYGFCVRCAKTLTLAQSQFVGYGKTCAGHMGWWYPTTKELKALTAQTEMSVAS